MTDELIIREALKTVTEFAHCHPDDQFDINECIQQTIFSVKKVWRVAHHIWRPFTAAERRELDDVLLRIKDELSARAYLKANACLKGRMVLKVNQTNAEALLTYEMGRRGLPYHFDWQKFRVKVSIKLSCKSEVTFIVKYKDIRAGKLTDILDKAMRIVEDIEAFGGHITVK